MRGCKSVPTSTHGGHWLEAGAEAIVVTASGCSVMVKDYGHFMQHDAVYAERHRASQRSRRMCPSDCRRMVQLKPSLKPIRDALPAIAYHPPCTLQHGMKLRGGVEGILRDAGFTLTPVRIAILLRLGGYLRYCNPKSAANSSAANSAILRPGKPAQIATANIGCATFCKAAPSCRSNTGSNLLTRRLAVWTACRAAPTMDPMSRADYKHFLTIPTRWMDNDIYGHVNNVVYYSWFDTVISRYLIRAGGLDIPQRAHCRLLRDSGCTTSKLSRAGICGVRVSKLGNSSVRYEVGLFGEDEQPRASARFLRCTFLLTVRRAEAMPVHRLLSGALGLAGHPA